ncbi:MAG: 2OG-Fe(II) oxygenase [Mycobacterium sp.]
MADTVLKVEELENNASELRRRFRGAEPFPHLVIDDLLRLPPSAISAFPDLSWRWWNEVDDTYVRNKRFCFDIELIAEPFKGLIRELNEPRFLKVLERITGIRQLLPDPHLFGGGIHLSGTDGVLTPHTDFHYYRAMNLYRRVNVIVYLNDGWSLEDGGCLSFYDADHRPVQTVVPEWGRAVVFRTDDQSVHGFTDPIAEGLWRRSVALFYYTAAPAEEFSGDEVTYYREHGRQAGAVRKGRFLVFRGLVHLSRNISILAHLANPNLGLAPLKVYLAYRRKAKLARMKTF